MSNFTREKFHCFKYDSRNLVCTVIQYKSFFFLVDIFYKLLKIALSTIQRVLIKVLSKFYNTENILQTAENKCFKTKKK